MKKLLIVQKAKAYDEAKSIMEKYLKSGNAGVIAENTIKKAFPELKESEDSDEKVRKALIKLVTNHASMDLFIEYDIHLDEALDWLEKQGKQNLNAWTEDDEKQARQIERIVHNDGCSKKLQEQIANWFKSIKYRVQPKVEWSEEDTQYINDTLALLSFGCSIHSVGEVKEWLQSLNNRVQLKQEWSEEDETAMHLACEFIRHHSRKGDSIGGIDCSELIERLKFLKDRVK